MRCFFFSCILFYMTIKFRNRFYFFLSVLGIFSFVFYSGLLVYGAFNNLLEAPKNPLRVIKFFKFNFHSSIASILFLGISAPIIAYSIFRGFEKTSSLEILFFTGIIFSIILEETRLFIPVFHLWNSSSKLIIFLGRIGVISRILTPISLLFASLFSNNDQLENSERNLFCLFVISIAIGFFYPINSNEISSTCTVHYGMSHLFFIIRILIFTITVLTTFINSHISGNFREDIHIYEKCFGIVIFFTGLNILQFCDSIPLLFIGITLYSFGCILYLKKLHYIANNWN